MLKTHQIDILLSNDSDIYRGQEELRKIREDNKRRVREDQERQAREEAERLENFKLSVVHKIYVSIVV